MIKNKPNSALVQGYWERRKTCPSTLLFSPNKNPCGLPLKRAHADGNLHYQKICSAAKSWAIFIRRYKITQQLTRDSISICFISSASIRRTCNKETGQS
jgi:hypothetical protein